MYRSLTQFGEADAREDAPPRSEEALWEQATQVSPDLFTTGQADALTLVDLRGA